MTTTTMMMMMMMFCCNHHNGFLLLLLLLILLLLLLLSSSPFFFFFFFSSSSSYTISVFMWCNTQKVSNPLHLYTVCPASIEPVPSPVHHILAEPFCSWSSHAYLLYVPLIIHVLSTYVYRLPDCCRQFLSPFC